MQIHTHEHLLRPYMNNVRKMLLEHADENAFSILQLRECNERGLQFPLSQ